MKRHLHFSHDPASRTVSGPDADRVLALIARWDGQGTLYGTQPAKAPDPLGSRRDMAIMLTTMLYEVPRELAAHLPPPDPIPPGAVA
ncbi:MAG: hypothetical protein GVY22_17020 [Gammaproteobacteria bacterium]|jgi:hypothetical protein|nr:hypothetical protein [Gammaproteobacteria bacterium]